MAPPDEFRGKASQRSHTDISRGFPTIAAWAKESGGGRFEKVDDACVEVVDRLQVPTCQVQLSHDITISGKEARTEVHGHYV